ncbi:MAG: ketose-bisphosphate aldolase [Erysipelotrichaceae bacterium]|nr:ketose-bisphosphate aldolase [Erysipelotrichaceae bacterium]
MLVSMKYLLDKAKDSDFAVGAFNASELTLFRAVIEEAEKLDSPVIVQASAGEFNFATRYFNDYVTKRAAVSNVPVALHLDHGHTVEEVIAAIQAGFTSVMIDGSMLPYEENVKLTKKVVDIAHAVGVTVEGEIGTIGAIANSDEGGVTNITYTKPDEVVDFVSKTGVDCLAIAIGTAHGIYPKGYVPKLQLDLLKEIKKVAPVPLVLHGGSNNPDDEIAEACRIGIAKVNISSDMKYAYFKKLNEVYAETGGFVPSKVMTPAIDAAKEVIGQKMSLFNSVNKASLYR